ncbi:uncharacterized protein LOC110726002 [Chenopodium quinoa]|uniref:uncharacterized protein LOC110726002 n=1 Tax=Chenopodium quinoa TaxID=63459 RepID=UPI000B76DCD7|nr:uncharacterized protein LOC110726002 [Chenopodium quinoa]
MNKELEALELNVTWELTTLPPNKTAIGCKWVYKTKFKPNGYIERCNGKVVARGDKQISGKDYKHTFSPVFSPVAKLTTVRVIIRDVSRAGQDIQQLDINNAFLHGFLDEEVYMTPPPGYKKEKPGQSKQNYFMFVLARDGEFTVVVAYVDDLLLTGSNSLIIHALKADLHSAFTIKDLESLKYFLGIEVSRTDAGILLNQIKYILDLLKDHNIMNCNHALFPFPKGMKLSNFEGDMFEDHEFYRRLIGKLLYLNMTRPNISYSVRQLSQFLGAPRVHHLAATIHVLIYMKGSLNMGLFYPATSGLHLSAFSDADWGACDDSDRSLTGYCSGLIKLKHVSSGQQLADIMSKPLGSDQYRALSSKIGLVQQSSAQEWSVLPVPSHS